MLRNLATSALVLVAAVLAATTPAAADQPPSVTICHQPGTPAEKTLTLPKPAADAQIAAQIATLGACGTTPPPQPCGQPPTPPVPAPTGQPVGGASVVAHLGDDPNVQETVTTSSTGTAQLVDLPDRTFNLTASASGNRIATLPTTVFDGTAVLRLEGFDAPSPVDNNDFSL